MAAARPPAATRPDTKYGRPAISGVASTVMSGRMKNSLSCRMPSALLSTIRSMLTLDQFWIQARLLTASKDWPMIAVGRVGSRSCSFDSGDSAGDGKYSRKMNSNEHETDLRAEGTAGVVKNRKRTCETGREQR